MSTLMLLSFAVIVAGDEPTQDFVAVNEPQFSWVKLANARRLPTPTEFRIALEAVESARQRFASQRSSSHPELPVLTHAARRVIERLDSALELYKELNPSFPRPAGFQDGQARLALFAAIQDYERLVAQQGEQQSFAPASPILRLTRTNLELAEVGESLVSLQLQVAGMRDVDRTKQAEILQWAEELQKHRLSLVRKMDETAIREMLDVIPTIRAESDQLATDVKSLVESAWALLGGMDSWATSKHVTQIDDIMTLSDELLNTLGAEAGKDRDGVPSEAELHSLLIRKVALLREFTLRLDVNVLLGTEVRPDRGLAELQRDLLQVELELCNASEERQRVCSHFIELAAELAKLAEADWRSGYMSSSRLTEFRLRLLDAKIQLLREQTQSERSSTGARK